MKRETVNRIRFVIEDLLPPIIRDSFVFRFVAEIFWGNHIRELSSFRERAPFLTDVEYEELYEKHPRVHEGTDNSGACVNRIIGDVLGDSVCDIGCGTGYLLTRINSAHPELMQLTGVDFVVEDADSLPNVEYIAAKIEDLPIQDDEYDTVICTHVIEHVLDYQQAISELRRICRRRLIIVVPREREYRYTFNPHFNFFPYKHSFLRAMHPVPASYLCEEIGRDIYYREQIE